MDLLFPESNNTVNTPYSKPILAFIDMLRYKVICGHHFIFVYAKVMSRDYFISEQINEGENQFAMGSVDGGVAFGVTGEVPVSSPVITARGGLSDVEIKLPVSLWLSNVYATLYRPLKGHPWLLQLRRRRALRLRMQGGIHAVTGMPLEPQARVFSP